MFPTRNDGSFRPRRKSQRVPGMSQGERCTLGAPEITDVVKRFLFVLCIARVSCLGAADAAYAGSRACAGCQAKIYQDYSRSAMGRSMSTARALPPVDDAAVFSEKLNRHFRVFRQGPDWYQSEYELDAAGSEIFKSTHKLEYAIGSGVNGRTYPPTMLGDACGS